MHFAAAKKEECLKLKCPLLHLSCFSCFSTCTVDKKSSLGKNRWLKGDTREVGRRTMILPLTMLWEKKLRIRHWHQVSQEEPEQSQSPVVFFVLWHILSDEIDKSWRNTETHFPYFREHFLCEWSRSKEAHTCVKPCFPISRYNTSSVPAMFLTSV